MLGFTVKVTVADANLDAVTQVLDLRKIDVAKAAEAGNRARQGNNAVLALAVFLTDVTSVTFQLHFNAVEEIEGNAGPVEEPARGGYMFLEEITITANELILRKDWPAGEYKILVTALVGGGS